MALTRAGIRQLNEADLRTQVLIPLFKAMGYRDVYHYHGGSMEQGKDIVMWKPSEFRERMNFAVVVKAGKISGKATGSSSAGEVCAQIHECLGRPYDDKITMQSCSVDRVLVVASGEIKKEAVAAIASILKGTNIEKLVDLIDGDELWEKVQRFLPESGALQKLSEVQEVFDSVSDNHRIIATLGGKGVMLSTQPKHPDAYKAEPLRFNVKLRYPNTPDGISARAAIERHFATGAPVSIPHDFINELEVPDLVQRFLPPATDDMRIEFGPRRIERTFGANIIVTPNIGAPLRVDNIEFRVIQIGTDEVTLDNEHQCLPFHFTLRLNNTDRRLNLAFQAKPDTTSIVDLLTCAHLQLAMASSCCLTIESRETLLPLIRSEIDGTGGDQPDPALVRLLEELVFIQTLTSIPIRLPAGDITFEDAQSVFDVARRIREGRLEATPNKLEADITREVAVLAVSDPELFTRAPLKISQEETWVILGQEIPLGPVITTVWGLGMTSQSLEILANDLVDHPDCDSFPVAFVPVTDDPRALVEYLNWTRAADRERGRQHDAPMSMPLQ